MAVIGHNINWGVAITLDATGEFTPWADGGRHGQVTATLQFNASWAGTLTFEGGVLVGGSMVSDPVTATNLNDGTQALTTIGAASATEIWRVSVASLDGFRVNATAVTTGSVNVTFQVGGE